MRHRLAAPYAISPCLSTARPAERALDGSAHGTDER